MKAMLIADGRLTTADVPDPERRDDTVLLEIHATAVNRADLMQKAGNYPSPSGWPEWPGLEAAGVVLRAPRGGRFRPGDKVCALLGGGGYAEKVAVPEALVMPLPPGLSFVEAAAVPEVFATAYLNFFLEGGLVSGDTVLIQAGASGLGIASIQLLKTLLPACRIVTTVGGRAKAEFVRKLGADVVVDHQCESLAAALAANPPDIALDCVGGPELGGYLEHLKFGGRWILIAALGGSRAEIPLDRIFRNRLRLIGSTLRSRTEAEKGAVLQALESSLWPAFQQGLLRPVIHAVLPLAAAEEAHAILENRANIGKVVLTVRG